MGYDGFGERPYKLRASKPATSIYLRGSDANEMDKLSCIHCKRTIADVKGVVDKIITTPMPLTDFEIGVNILCKLCKQQYRLLVSAS